MKLTRKAHRDVFFDSWSAMHSLISQAEPLLDKLDYPEACRQLVRLLELAEFQAASAAAALEDYCRARAVHADEPGTNAAG